MFRDITMMSFSVVCRLSRFPKCGSSAVVSFKQISILFVWWTHLLGSTALSSIWEQFLVGCYVFKVPSERL